MRTDNRFLLLSTLGLLTAASCTLITDVDRTKIPVDGGPSDGGEGATGGTAGRGAGGKAGGGGKSGAGGSGTGGSMGGESGGGGEAGGTSGSGGTTGGSGGTGGSSGTSGASATGGSSSGSGGTSAGAGGEGGGTNAECGNGVVETGETCDDGNINACGTCAANCASVRTIPTSADGAIVIGSLTFIMDGDTFTLDDGTNTPAVFEFDCGPPDCTTGTTGVASGNNAIPFTAVNFDNLNDETEYRDLVIAAVDAANTAGDILTTAADGGSAPATVSLSNVEVITDTVGNPNWVTSQRCTAGLGCAADGDCLTGSCNTTSSTCD